MVRASLAGLVGMKDVDFRRRRKKARRTSLRADPRSYVVAPPPLSSPLPGLSFPPIHSDCSD